MSDRPNVVVIMTDQQRADVSAREGFGLDTTPFLDALARQGVWFNRGYTSAPVCAPARVSLLTGRYVSAHRCHSNWNGPDAVFTKDLFDVFREHGHATAMIGKNHSHLSPASSDTWLEAGHWGMVDERPTKRTRQFNQLLDDANGLTTLAPTPFPLEEQLPCRLVDRATEWVRSVREAANDADDDADNRFLLWLSFPEPHNPYQVPEPYYSMFPPESLPPTASDKTALAGKSTKYRYNRARLEEAYPPFDDVIPRARANYFGMLRLIDDQVKRFVAFLEAEGLRDNTIIVFTSDHGDFVGEYGLLKKGPELPECLTRIPLQFTGPGIVAQPDAHPAHVSIVDVMPTLCQAIGADLPEGVQGRSLWPMLTGQDYPADEFRSAYVEQGIGGQHITADCDYDPTQDGFMPADGETWGEFDELNTVTQSGTMRMVRKGDWKLIVDMEGTGQLYNLADDPAELNNRYGQPDVAALQMDMLEELLTWTLRVNDTLPTPGPRYTPKGRRRK
ncbi:MAG: sulfatase family protein [Planctomycetota bacterium]|jgi:arylsulfatase A-like enzyme